MWQQQVTRQQVTGIVSEAPYLAFLKIFHHFSTNHQLFWLPIPSQSVTPLVSIIQGQVHHDVARSGYRLPHFERPLTFTASYWIWNF